MAFEGGVFIDILTRLNMASVDKVLKDAQAAMKEAGSAAGTDFSAAFNTRIGTSSRAAFDPLVEASNAAFRDMEIGMANLQAKEAQLNALRASSWRKTTDAIVAAQREVDAAVTNTQRLMADASAKNALYRDTLMATPGLGSRGTTEERTPSTGNNREVSSRGAAAGAFAGRAVRGLGAGAAFGLAGAAAYGVRQDARIQNNLAQLSSLQGETPANVGMITQSVWSQAVQTGYSPNDISNLYPSVERAVNPLTGGRYRGQDATNIVGTALQLARVSNISPEEALQGLTTAMFNYRQGPSGARGSANVLAQGLSGFKGSAADFFEAQHTIDPVAEMAGIGMPEVVAALDMESQTGQTAQQSAQSTRNLIANLARPSGVMSQALQQLGINPENMSEYLSKNGIAGSLGQITQQIAKDQVGPNGSVVLGALANKPLAEQQQAQIADLLSPKAREYIESPDFQQSLVSGFSARNILKQAGGAGLDNADMPLIETWLNEQKKINGASDVINRNQPEVQNLYGAFGSAFGTKEAGQAAIMLGGSPQALNAYQQRSQQLSGAQDNPNAFTDAFKTAMDTNINQWHVLGQSLGDIAGHIGNSLLPTLKTWTEGLSSLIGLLDRHKGAEQALIDVLVDLAALWGAAKVKNMFTDAATSLGLLSDAAKTSAAEVTTMGTEAEAAGTEMAEAGIGGALKGAAGNIAAAFAPAALATLIGVQVANAVDHSDALKNFEQNNPLAQNPVSNWINQHTPSILGGNPGWQNPSTPATSVPPSAPNSANPPTVGGIPIPGLEIPGRALGGMIDQSLMGMPDTGGDSYLGLVNGSPVGLRGGEGILTPEAVARIGGKKGVDALNSGEDNPWADPFKVGTSFYNSFAKGVAKYSPFGKYLTAAGQTLDSLEQQHEDAQREQQQVSKKSASGMIDYLKDLYSSAGMSYTGSGISGIEKSLLGISKGSKGIPLYGNGRSTGSGSPAVMDAIAQAAAGMGLTKSEYDDVKWIFSRESGFNPTISNKSSGAYGLGQFLGHQGDKYGAMGAYSGDPYKETQAAIQYMRDRYGGPAGAKAYWQTHGNYATGGVIPGLLNTNSEDSGGVIVRPGWGPDEQAQRDTLTGNQGGMTSGGGGNFNPGIRIDLSHISAAPTYTGQGDGPHKRPYPGRYTGTGIGLGGFATGGVLPMAPPPAPPPRPVTPVAGATAQGSIKSTPVNNPKYQTKPAPNNLPGMPGGPKAPRSDKGGTHDMGGTHTKTSVHGIVPGPSMIPGGTAPENDRNIKANPSQQLTAEGKGFGAGGGLLGMAEGAAASAANAFAPGSGQAAQMLFALANRGIGYAGQLVGIGMKSLIETFLPNDSEAADPSKNIFGKMALGIAGAHPSGKNWAGSHAGGLDTKKDLDQGSMQAKQQPGIHVNGDIHNHTGDHQETFNAINKAVNFSNHAGWFAGI